MPHDAPCLLRFDDALEREALVAVGDALAPLFDEGAGDRCALIVVSDNAGTATSVQFWADAQRTGVALASPELFPWCLANAPCGALARRFQVTGPNLTLLGEAEALAAGFDAAADLFGAARIDQAVIVALSFASPGSKGLALGLRLNARALVSATIRAQREAVYAAPSLRAAMAALAAPASA